MTGAMSTVVRATQTDEKRRASVSVVVDPVVDGGPWGKPAVDV